MNAAMGSRRITEPDAPARRVTTHLTPRRAIVFEMLEHAADNGLPAPSDMAIADAIGIRSLGSANLHVSKLAEAGLIRIERPSRNRRVIVIVESGARTAAPPPAKHQADGAGRPERRTRPKRAPGTPAKVEMGGGMLTSEQRMAKAGGPPVVDRKLGLLKSTFPPATECQWQYGDGPFTACGRAVKPGSSYCAEHHRRCWQEYVLVPRKWVGA